MHCVAGICLQTFATIKFWWQIDFRNRNTLATFFHIMIHFFIDDLIGKNWHSLGCLQTLAFFFANIICVCVCVSLLLLVTLSLHDCQECLNVCAKSDPFVADVSTLSHLRTVDWQLWSFFLFACSLNEIYTNHCFFTLGSSI